MGMSRFHHKNLEFPWNFAFLCILLLWIDTDPLALHLTERSFLQGSAFFPFEAIRHVALQPDYI
jgi:hypothetical protein